MASRHEVLITRPETEAAVTADRLRVLNLVPIVAPLLRVQCLPLRAPAPLDAVLITSGNAVPAIAGLCLPLLAVGDATAERAEAAGFRDVVSAGGDADALLALAKARLAPGAVLLLATGCGQGWALAGRLRAAGFRVHRRVVYVARPARRLPDAARLALERGRLLAAIFLSAETARSFTRLVPPVLHAALTGVDALAIGQPAADALALLPWRRVRVSLGPTLEQVLALL